MLKILTLIGARPQFIKAAAISRAIQKSFSTKLEEVIVHSGQHYDANMSAIFFEELAIPKPKYTFNLTAHVHSAQTAQILHKLEEVLEVEKPNAVLVYGDTNTTMAGALAASKKHIPVIHIEAGLRSFNKAMPEEINRVLTDHCSSLLFCPTQTAVNNLAKESIVHSNDRCSVDKPKVYACGDIMYDNSLYFSKQVDDSILIKHNLVKNKFLLFTMHRPSNTDHAERLRSICSMVLELIEKQQLTVVFPMHPRTKKALHSHLSSEQLDAFTTHPLLKIIEPASFIDMISLEKNCEMVITDSGGVQKEAYFFEKPSLILRSETEWVEIVTQGAAVLVNQSNISLLDEFELLRSKKIKFPQLFGDGNSAQFICRTILEQL
ncbi:MAG: UDP-N-acetylglucosamine 2-epimerase (non-hydrolyzing) [Flavobacteriales bacterium]|jgi:UDP-GlcNAc3NAcA epimerase|tara:strand:+ start:408 stop:1541 length:1134 start_codon:yes stop_codon:yes gene_type:complete